MGRIDEIIAKQKELAEELELAKQQERDAVLKDIKEKIKMFDFKTIAQQQFQPLARLLTHVALNNAQRLSLL